MAACDYHDENGALLYQTVRYELKDFRQRRPDGNGNWSWKLNGVRYVLYRLPELLKTKPGTLVFITEGEKDSDNVRSLGLAATCAVGGSNKSVWKDCYNHCLKDKAVCVLLHNDAPGKKYADSVAYALFEFAKSVKVVELPGLPEKGGDVSDWINAGHDQLELLRLVGDTPVYKPQLGQPETQQFNLTDAGNGERYAAEHSKQIKYYCKSDEWFTWDGRRWNANIGEANARRYAVDIARRMQAEALKIDNHEERRGLLEHATCRRTSSSPSASRRSAHQDSLA